jgi:hypothetical protein
MEVSGQLHALGHFTPEDRTPGTHCTEGWVGPQPEWVFHKDTALSLLGFEPQIIQPVAQTCKLCCPGYRYFYSEI